MKEILTHATTRMNLEDAMLIDNIEISLELAFPSGSGAVDPLSIGH